MSDPGTRFLGRFEPAAEAAADGGAPGPKPRQRRGGRGVLKEVEVAIDDAERRAKSGEWDGAKGSTLVGLYAFCHRLLYGIVPDELFEIGTFRGASKAAAGLLHSSFEDRPEIVVDFVKWCWEREKKRSLWALQQGKDRNRLSWRLQFSASMVTDWRVGKQTRGR